MLSVFAALSQLERDTIRQRQREGIDLALAEGRAYGRRKIKIDTTFELAYKQWKTDVITAVEAMRRSGLTRSTFYRRVNEYESTQSCST